MFTTISNLLGGIGLFLLGMTLLSDGLKSFAGDSLRRALLAFTRRPVTAFFSGMFATALVQSSSATTLMTIGFVSAGLLPFAQSVGVLIGASLGTTSTGWIVSILGLNLSISAYALLFIAVGAAARLFLRGPLSSLGLAVAGFGLVFLGIELLKTGMTGITTAFDFSTLPSRGLFGRMLGVAIGVALTVVMQSSSAAMATTLTALYAGAINFEQAACLAIGSAIGTTVTAGIACIGASVHAKRTALAHVVFNLATGVIALVLLPALLAIIRWLQTHAGLEEGAISLALFHSLFITIGVVVFLPFLARFSHFIERILPEKTAGFARYLDNSLLALPSVALEAVTRCLLECRAVLVEAVLARLSEPPGHAKHREVEEVVQAIHQSRKYITSIQSEPDDSATEVRRISGIHAMDHLQRLAAAVGARDTHPGCSERVREWEERLRGVLEASRAREPTEAPSPVETICGFSKEIAAWRRDERAGILERAARGGADPAVLFEELETIQWLDQIAFHCCRIEHHLAVARGLEDGGEAS